MTPHDFSEHLARDRRLVILRSLSEAPGYSANLSILTEFLGYCGHRASRDTVGGDLDWLREQGLVKLNDGDMVVAEITTRGLDVAMGRASHPGVKRPSPK